MSVERKLHVCTTSHIKTYLEAIRTSPRLRKLPYCLSRSPPSTNVHQPTHCTLPACNQPLPSSHALASHLHMCFADRLRDARAVAPQRQRQQPTPVECAANPSVQTPEPCRNAMQCNAAKNCVRVELQKQPGAMHDSVCSTFDTDARPTRSARGCWASGRRWALHMWGGEDGMDIAVQ